MKNFSEKFEQINENREIILNLREKSEEILKNFQANLQNCTEILEKL